MIIKKKKLRVLQAIRQGLIGGGESHVLALVSTIDKSIYEPIVLSFTDGPMIERLNELGVKHHVINSLRAFDVFKWQKVLSFLKKEKIDLIHVHGTRAASNILWAAKKLKIPVIYTIHGWSFHDDQSRITKFIRIQSEKYITRKTSCNICVSDTNMKTGQSTISSFRSIVINNGIDKNRFSPDNKYPDIRKELDIPENSFLIAFIARMTLQKCPLLLVQSFHDIQRKFKNCHLLMVGDGELKKSVEDLIKKLDITEKVSIINFRQDIPAILYAADLYCLPSLWEGLPIGLLEAMSMGKPVIATKVDGSSEIVTNKQNGILITPNSRKELTEAITLTLEDVNLRQQIENNARKTILEKYNVEKMTLEISSVYHRFIKE